MRKIPLTYYPDSPRGRYEIEERWEKSELPKVETDAA
jgi:hypothetical protein